MNLARSFRGRAARSAVLAAPFVLFLPTASSAPRPVIDDTSWSLTGRERLNGVAKEGRVTERIAEGDFASLEISFPGTTSFTSEDQNGTPFAGTRKLRGRTGRSLRLKFDEASSDRLTETIAAWVGEVQGATASVTVQSTSTRGKLRDDTLVVSLIRRFKATAGESRVTGTYVARCTGSPVN